MRLAMILIVLACTAISSAVFCQSKLVFPLTHSGDVIDIDYSPDGQYVVTCGTDGAAIIWELATGKMLHYFPGHSEGCKHARFSADGKFLMTTSLEDQKIIVWDILKGNSTIVPAPGTSLERVEDFYVQDGTNDLLACAQSMNSSGSPDKTLLYAYNFPSKKWKQLLVVPGLPMLNKDGTHLVYVDSASDRFVDVKTKSTVIKKPGFRYPEWSSGYSTESGHSFQSTYNENLLAYASDSVMYFLKRDASNNTIDTVRMIRKAIYREINYEVRGSRVKIFPNGSPSNIDVNLIDNSVRISDQPFGTVEEKIVGKKITVFQAYDGHPLITINGADSLRTTDVNFQAGTVSVSPLENFLLLQEPSKVTIYSVAQNDYVDEVDGKQLMKVDFLPGEAQFIASFSNDGTTVNEVAVVDTKSRKVIRTLASGKFKTHDVVANNKLVVVGPSFGSSVDAYEISTGKKNYDISEVDGSGQMLISKDGQYLLQRNLNKIVCFDAATGKSVKTITVLRGKENLNEPYVEQVKDRLFVKNYNEVGRVKNLDHLELPALTTKPAARFNDLEGQLLNVFITGTRHLITTFYEPYPHFILWDLKGNELLNWMMIDEKDWLVTHASGLFDASPGAMEKLYFIQGYDIIGFNQLKARYYEPGLWKKIIAGEKLRQVAGLKAIDLPPLASVGQVDDKGYLPVTLTNRGSGIGEVTVLVNGKEVISDARPKGFDPNAETLSLKLYLDGYKNVIAGGDNLVVVKAWNAAHWVVSRGELVRYTKPGKDMGYKPAIHIISCGVSDYTGADLDLKYAAKDAMDVSRALQLGANALFGTKRSFVYDLTTAGTKDKNPTKENILKAFEKVTTEAHPLDVVVVYLSGHGINHGGVDGDWYYLTQDAYTSDPEAYNDPEIRNRATLSSNELVDLFKKVPALKQVLMIDACASGKVVENLMAKRDVESSTLRAMDRMRDRTGLHIITGCTADAVSYEASRYGQGVLTYSLLEGMRGAALRDEQFIDVNRLFQYAHDRVPQLAEGIGGIQTPQVFSPSGGQSFDVGQLNEHTKLEIPIAKIRPVYIRSVFQDESQLEDVLLLGKKVDEALNDEAARGAESKVIFVDVRDYPEGCKLSGLYSQKDGKIQLKMRRKCDGENTVVDIDGKTVEELRDKILKQI